MKISLFASKTTEQSLKEKIEIYKAWRNYYWRKFLRVCWTNGKVQDSFISRVIFYTEMIKILEMEDMPVPPGLLDYEDMNFKDWPEDLKCWKERWEETWALEGHRDLLC